MRAITKGPRHHWFGYYDKWQINPSGRYVLGMAVDFEHRSPRADDVIEIGMVDLRDGDRWIRLGVSRAWSWQQGCMLQWLPGSASTVVWNDRVDDRFVCHVVDVAGEATGGAASGGKAGTRRTLPAPIYALSPDGRTAVSPDFRRLNDTRPGYGYAGLPDPRRDLDAPTDTGITIMDMATGAHRLLIPFSRVAAMPCARHDVAGKHWFNHLLFNPDGSRFIFLNRWRNAQTGEGWRTRMFTAAADGSDIRLVDDYGGVSHFIWRDPRHILSWAYARPEGDGFFLYDIDSGGAELVDKEAMPVDGHCTYLPETSASPRWILNDCYPGKDRLQRIYIYHVPSRRRLPVADLHAPPGYDGEWRCDTHPRTSRDGATVVVDSAHGGNGRQLYLLDISALLES